VRQDEATKLPQTAKNVKGARIMDTHVKAITFEQFCPPRKAFIAPAGRAEYQSRANQHRTSAPA